MSRDIVTPAEENGYCVYACREEHDPQKGVIVKCDFQGTCEYKSTRLVKGTIHTCNNFTK